MNKKLFGVFLVFVVLGIGFISAECVDSDGGNNIYVKGTITGLNSQNNQSTTVSDVCLLNKNLAGSCNSDQDCYVAEYYCSNSFIEVSTSKCLYGCSDGACLTGTSTCIEEGKSYNTYPRPNENVTLTAKCCEGLTAISVSQVGDNGICSIKTDSAICTKCGNGICGLGENKCNCPKDCSNDCKMLYWFDSNTNVCGYKQFCGAYMYYGLRTFESKDECIKNLPNVTITPQCTDSDGGINYYVKGKFSGIYKGQQVDNYDSCLSSLSEDGDSVSSGQYIGEGYCENNELKIIKDTCPNGCKDGACIKGEQISEKITCKFIDTKKEQKCYLAGQWSDADVGTKFCIAYASSGVCDITYSAPKGEKVTWKSTCGQYQYTTQDGNDETIVFKCKEGETTTTEIQNQGFMYAYWQCYDGYENKAGDGVSCYPSDNFAAKAKDDCQNHCYSDNSKCGVNSFSVNVECYTNESGSGDGKGGPIRYGKCGDGVCDYGENTPSYPYYCPQDCETEFSKSCIKEGESANSLEGKKCCLGLTESLLSDSVFKCVKEDIIICKDSCPLDGKCYQFGYRKTGKYCSDSGAFIEELKANSVCDNNFECSSNICVSGKCIDEGLLNKIINWFKKLFGG